MRNKKRKSQGIENRKKQNRRKRSEIWRKTLALLAAVLLTAGSLEEYAAAGGVDTISENTETVSERERASGSDSEKVLREKTDTSGVSETALAEDMQNSTTGAAGMKTGASETGGGSQTTEPENTQNSAGGASETGGGSQTTEPENTQNSAGGVSETGGGSQSSTPEEAESSTQSDTKGAENSGAQQETDNLSENTGHTEMEIFTEGTQMEGEEPSTDMAASDPALWKELLFQKDNLIIRAEKTDGTAYEPGSCMTVMDLQEMLENPDQEELEYYDNLLKNPIAEKYAQVYQEHHTETEWTEAAVMALEKQIRTAIAVTPYSIEFYEKNGAVPEVCEQRISFERYQEVNDAVLLQELQEGTKKLELTVYDGGMNAESLETELTIAEEERKITLTMQTDRTGLFAIAQYDTAFVFAEDEIEEQTEETETELDADLYWDGDVNNYKSDGTLMTASSKFTTDAAYGGKTYSGKYGFLGWISGISGISTFMDNTYCNSSNLQVVSMTPNNEGRGTLCSNSAYYPKSDAPAGHFGWIVSRAGFNVANNCYVDVLVTVSNWRTWAYDKTGKKAAANPCFGMNNTEGKLEWVYYGPDPAVEFDIKVIKSGTANGSGLGYTLMPGDYRFCWEDVDHGQRYGIFLDGSARMDARYALNNSVLYTDSITIFGKTYELFQSPSSGGTDTGKALADYYRWACWTEVSELSQFHMLIAQSYTCKGMTGAWSSPYAANTITNRSNTIADNISKGNTQVSNYGMMWMNWSGAAPGMTAPALINKHTSNDGAAWDTANTLEKIEQEWWYSMVLNVPFISDPNYYYDSLNITDLLPAGVDYKGSFAAVNLDTGQDASSLFSLTPAADNGNSLRISATGAAMDSASFYSHYYRLRFKVAMNQDTMPAGSIAYQENSAVYTVQNTAGLNYSTRSTAAQIQGDNSNTVTTTVTVNRVPQQSVPVKGLDGDPGLTTKNLKQKYETITFSVYQAVPVNQKVWYPSSITFSDILQDALEYKGAVMYFSSGGAYEAAEGWTMQNTGQTVTASRRYLPAYNGGTLRMDITCKIRAGFNLDGYQKVIDQKTYVVIPNRAKVKFSWEHGSPAEIENTTNEVTVLFRIPKANLVLIKTNEDTGEVIPDAQFTVYEWDGSSYSINAGIMAFQAASGQYRIENLLRTAKNQGKFKVTETLTPAGHTGTWEQEFVIPDSDEDSAVSDISFTVKNPMAKGNITVLKTSRKQGKPLSDSTYEITAEKDIRSPQGKVLVSAGTMVERLTTGADGKAVSGLLYPGEYLVTEIQAPVGYALDAAPQKVVIVYKDKNTPITNETVTFVNDRLYAYLTLTKEIDTQDIVWAHGEPVFFFDVTGKDVLGTDHGYHEMVVFTPENAGEGPKSLLSVTIKVLAGTYTASESKVMRYQLEEIRDILQGTRIGDAVKFDVSKGETGKAVFYNGKTTDEDPGDTSSVRNQIVK